MIVFGLPTKIHAIFKKSAYVTTLVITRLSLSLYFFFFFFIEMFFENIFFLLIFFFFQVLEVNASSRRTGKSVLSKLSEATQSQSVKQSQSHFLTAAQSHELLANQSPSKPPPLNPIASLFQKKQEANGGKLKENTKKQEANGRKVKESTKKQESSGGKVKENTKKQESNGGKVKESTKGKKGRKSVSPNVCAASKAIKKSKLSLAKKKIFKGNAKKLVKLSAEGKKEEIEGGKKKEFTLLLFEDVSVLRELK